MKLRYIATLESTTRNPTQKSWIAKRNKAIERLVSAAWSDNELSGDDDPMNTAADAVAVAHIAASLDWGRAPTKQWDYEKSKAMERLVRAWAKHKSGGEDDPEIEQELNIALNELAVAHSAATFEFCSGPLEW